MCKNKYIYLNEDIWLMAKKMRLEMKNRSSRYNINRPRLRHGRKCTKHKKCLDIMMFISIRQHLNYISSLIHEKVKQHWPRRYRTSWMPSERLMFVQFTSCIYGGSWFKKSVGYKKSVHIQLSKIFLLSVSYHYAFLKTDTSEKNFTQKDFIVW